MSFSSAVATARVAIPLSLIAFITMQAEPRQVSSPSVRDQVTADESSCVATLRVINVAQATYWGGDPAKGYASSLSELGPTGSGILDSVVASGKKGGYSFRLFPKTGHRPIKRYIIIARPVKRLVKDQRSFFTDETSVIRFTTKNRSATAADPPLDAPTQD